MRTANRSFRKVLARRARNGVRSIRVYGTQATGFKLIDEKTQVIVGPVAGFARQKDAVTYAADKLGTLARKIVKLVA